MTTRFENGFTVATNSATELLALVNGFRPWVVEAGQNLLEDFILGAKGRDTLDAWILWLDMREKTVDRGLRGPKVATNFDLYFFPDADRFLGVMVCEHQAWMTQWLAQSGVSEYAYQPGGAPPPEVSAEMWARRAADWALVLGDREMIEAGFKIKVSVDGGPSPRALTSQASVKRQ